MKIGKSFQQNVNFDFLLLTLSLLSSCSENLSNIAFRWNCCKDFVMQFIWLSEILFSIVLVVPSLTQPTVSLQKHKDGSLDSNNKFIFIISYHHGTSLIKKNCVLSLYLRFDLIVGFIRHKTHINRQRQDFSFYMDAFVISV